MRANILSVLFTIVYLGARKMSGSWLAFTKYLLIDLVNETHKYIIFITSKKLTNKPNSALTNYVVIRLRGT